MADHVQTYANADSIYEDVEGVIQNATPHKTPFIASIGKTKAKATLHEWLEDTYKAPTGTNKAVEGADATNAARTAATRPTNSTQIMEDTFSISGTDGAVNLIGRSSDAKYELSKSLKYLNTELEKTAINSTAAVAGDATTEREMCGMAGFITTNDESYTSYATTNAFTSTKLLAMSKGVWENSDGESHNLLVGATTANDIANWTQDNRITVNTNASDKAMVMAVMVLETPFGRINIVLERYLTLTESTTTYNWYTSAYMYAPEKFKIAWLRPWKTTPLAKAGDADRFQTVGEMTLVCYNEKAAANCDALFDSSTDPTP